MSTGPVEPLGWSEVEGDPASGLEPCSAKPCAGVLYGFPCIECIGGQLPLPTPETHALTDNPRKATP